MVPPVELMDEPALDDPPKRKGKPRDMDAEMDSTLAEMQGGKQKSPSMDEYLAELQTKGGKGGLLDPERTDFPARFAQSTAHALTHPVETAESFATAIPKALGTVAHYAIGGGSLPNPGLESGVPVDRPDLELPPKPSGSEAGIAAAQLAATALGGPISRTLGSLAEPFIVGGLRAIAPSVVARTVAAPIIGKALAGGVGRVGAGALAGATFNPEDPAVGSAQGAILAGAHEVASGVGAARAAPEPSISDRYAAAEPMDGTVQPRPKPGKPPAGLMAPSVEPMDLELERMQGGTTTAPPAPPPPAPPAPPVAPAAPAPPVAPPAQPDLPAVNEEPAAPTVAELPPEQIPTVEHIGGEIVRLRKVIADSPPYAADERVAAEERISTLTKEGLDRANGKPAAPQELPARNFATAETGKPFSDVLMRGEGGTDPKYNPLGAQVPILGEGKYTTPNAEHAADFGPTITHHPVELENPLVIDSDAQWRALTKAAGWQTPNPTGSPSAVTDIARLRQMIEQQGHDGVVVKVAKFMDDGHEMIDESRAKTLGKVFGDDQAIEFHPKNNKPIKYGEKPEADPEAETERAAIQNEGSGRTISPLRDAKGRIPANLEGHPTEHIKEEVRQLHEKNQADLERTAYAEAFIQHTLEDPRWVEWRELKDNKMAEDARGLVTEEELLSLKAAGKETALVGQHMKMREKAIARLNAELVRRGEEPIVAHQQGTAADDFSFGANVDQFQAGMGGRKRPIKGSADTSLFGGDQTNLLGEANTLAESDVGKRVEKAPAPTGVAPELPGAIPAEEMTERRDELGFEKSEAEGTAGDDHPDLFQAGMGGSTRPIAQAVNATPPNQATGSISIPAEDKLPNAPGMKAAHGLTLPKFLNIPYQLARLFNPRAMGNEANLSADALAHLNAERVQHIVQTQVFLRDGIKSFGTLSKRESVMLWNASEGRNWDLPANRALAEQILPGSPKVIDGLDTRMKQLTKELVKYGILRADAVIYGYRGRMWDRAKAGKDFAGIMASIYGKRPFAGPESFTKERTHPHFIDGINAGLTPVSYNMLEVQAAVIAEIEHSLMAAKYIEEEVAKGRMKPVMLGMKPPVSQNGDQWARIGEHDPSFTIYGPHTETVKYSFDLKVREQLNAVIAGLKNLKHVRAMKLGGKRAGYAEGPYGKKMASKFGSPDTVIMHELGHILQFRYDFMNELIRPAPRTVSGVKVKETKAERSDRVTIKKEIRALADMRNEGGGDLPKDYIRNHDEKAANILHAFIGAPELMKRVAPMTYGRMRDFLASKPELKPLLDIKPSLTLGQETGELEIPGMRIMGHYYAEPGSAQIVNNHLSKGLKGNAIWDALIAPGTAMTQAILGASGFHAGTIALEQMASEAGLAIEKLANAGAEGAGVAALKGLPLKIGRSVTPGVGLSSIGHKIITEYETPGSFPEYAKVLDLMVKGGFQAHSEGDFWSGERMENLRAAWKDAVNKSLPPGPRVWGAMRVPLDTVWAAFEKAAAPVMNRWVPRMKAYAIYEGVARELARLPEGASIEMQRAAAREVVNEMSFRMGQVTYDNFFINKALLHVMQFLTFAPGWTFGTIVQNYRGVKDVARAIRNGIGFRRGTRTRPAKGQPYRGESGEGSPQDRVGKSAAYWMGLFVLQALGNMLLTYLRTGDGPHSPIDLVTSRDGTKDKYGNPNRRILPGYLMKDDFSWTHKGWQTALNKMNPVFSAISQWMTNRDYYGNYIWDPQATDAEKSKQMMRFALKSFSPLSVRNMIESRRRGESGGTGDALNFFGVGPAPKEIQQTPAQNLMDEFLRNHGHRTATPDDAEHYQVRRNAITKAKTGGGMSGITEAVRSGAMTAEQGAKVANSFYRSTFQERFANLSWLEAYRVYKVADPREERPLIKAQMIRKLIHARMSGVKDVPQLPQ